MNKRRNSLAFSSDDDDDTSSSEKEDQPEPRPSSSIAVPGKRRPTRTSDSDSGSETNTDSDSDTEQPRNQRSGKAILAKDKSTPPLPKSGTKRPSEETSRETNSKREKKDEEKKMTKDSKKKGLETAVKSNGISNVDDMRVLVHESDWFEKYFLVRGIAGFCVDEHYVKQCWRGLPVETKKKVEEKVKMLQANEIEFVLHKTQILHEVTSMIVGASKNKP
ncbi:probable transcription factor At1g61730 [Raphanus sativus]|uniref:Probable transcription factor At1g61730 n=1 Tax=Raphanus sativus TaxID=3726 RepID=A0A6J0LDB6_RAPSA|nr:probable transcription factor At1g61730 [Raphanus sativus]